ncbi:LPS export ABC transporter ATP-binding protein [Parasphaerochaeta coccoides]|uniref:Fe(3+)-transporting ATPase n=1 Tax=Parasphaerochaeta coccoides (strain ATCC BAA-1237 / DSM 17374 / SPN1) TaxID=760011 RepID=F4GJP0_PARC1|nr:LPS export ABC transporter ATP-binding protein [Parasphaerochaeta coccoides]AEC02787.1 Fe(3+)-transporting ATPase [Parasphaerochaeta coccoides DSM 17374]
MADTATSVLNIQHLMKYYGKKPVVRDISFSMRSGEVVGLLGPNGAGKTTTFYMVVGFLRADSGKISIDDTDVTELPMYRRSLLGLSYLPQEASIFRKLSVRDNIHLVSESRSDLSAVEKKELTDRLMEEFGITGVMSQKGYTLSGGERRRTEIARALATSPRFLLLDEPFAGIDPKAVYEIRQIIRHLAAQGIGVLLTDHNVRDALAITDCSHIIHEGTLLVSGTKQDLLNDPTARHIYFGDEFEDV